MHDCLSRLMFPAPPLPIALLCAVLIASQSPTKPAPSGATTAQRSQKSDQPLPTLPGEITAKLTPELADKYARSDANADGWETEVFSERAGRQLSTLGELLSHVEQLDAEHLTALFDASFACGPLRAVELSEVFNGVVKVLRPNATQPDAPKLVGVAGAGDALRALLAPFDATSSIGCEFDIISVESDDAGVTTAARFTAKARPSSGATQQNATWRIRWTPLPSEPADAVPKITRIELENDFSEAHGPAGGQPMFAECTEAVLGASESYVKQLKRSVESWAATLDVELGVSLIGHEGLALGDIDGDGLDELFVAQPGGLPKLLFHHEPNGTLRDISREAGVDFLDAARSALFADFDNDGDQDLALEMDPKLVFLRNDGRGHFELAFEAQAPSTTSLSAADFDGDGDLDLYCCGNALPDQVNTTPLPYQDANNGRPNTLLRNESGAEKWQFVDATKASGLDENNRRFSFASGWEDYDNDGDQDLYVANDFGRNNLYRNDGGHFRDVAAEAGVEDMGASMGVTWADFDRDGWMDLYVSGTFSSAGKRIASQRRFMSAAKPETRADVQRCARGNTLFKNNGDGTFADVSESAGVSMGGWAWGAIFTDFDNNGLSDLFVPSGFITGEDADDLDGFFWRQTVAFAPNTHAGSDRASYEAGWFAVHRMLREGKSWGGREEDCAYLNMGGGKFADISAVTGLASADDGRAAANVDWDFDGKTDLWLAGRSSPRVRFYRNQTQNAGAFVSLLLRGTKCNRDAIGARVEVHTAGQPLQIMTLHAGEGHLAQSSKWMHFGLGDAKTIERVVVRWPAPLAAGAAASEVFENVDVNAFHVLVQGSGMPQRWTPPSTKVELAAASPAPLPSTEQARIVLAARAPLPTLTFLTDDGKPARIAANIEAPVLVKLWATWCSPCIAELREFTAREADIKASGVTVLALNVEGESKREAALEFLQRMQWDFHAGFATTDLLDTLDVLQRALLDRWRRMPLPVSFLIDAEHKLAVIYKGPVSVDTLLADTTRLRASLNEIRNGAVPFPGVWHSAPASRDLARIVAEFAARGMMQAAAEVEQQRPDLRKLTQARVLYEFGIAKAGQDKLDEAIVNFRQAVELVPDYFDALSALATALHQTGKLAEAIPIYEVALRLDSRNADVLQNLALAHFVGGERNKAMQDLAMLEAIDSASAAALAKQFTKLEGR